uniref:Uncharacterized protein n=1 Tax=Timema bartmani TaxID=61472 RepID=A0A7R9FB42_9NEOP|nr:unnamed protein product [Timema bartmani]
MVHNQPDLCKNKPNLGQSQPDLVQNQPDLSITVDQKCRLERTTPPLATLLYMKEWMFEMLLNFLRQNTLSSQVTK